MKTTAIRLACASLTLLAVDVVLAGDHVVTGNLAITTDYRFRGMSQTDGGPALQGGIDYKHAPTGLYLGVWGSNVDSSDSGYANASLESDFYAGWSGTFDKASVNVKALRYQYFGTDNKDSNTNEFYLILGYDFDVAALSGTVAYSPDWYGLDDSHYYALDLSVPLPNDFTLTGHYGWNQFDHSDADYHDYSIGIGTQFGGFGFNLSYIDTDLDSHGCASPFKCDSTAVFTISKTFE